MRISLRQLLVYVTMICFVLGVIVTFPDAMEVLVFATLLVTPMLVCALFAFLSAHPKTTFLMTGLGACLGLCFSPAAFVALDSVVRLALGLNPNWQSPTFLYDVTPPAIGALTAGLLSTGLRRSKDKRLQARNEGSPERYPTQRPLM